MCIAYSGRYRDPMPQWSPEIVVDSALARRLIGERFPELDASR